MFLCAVVCVCSPTGCVCLLCEVCILFFLQRGTISASVRNSPLDDFSSVFTVRPDLNCNDASSYWMQWYTPAHTHTLSGCVLTRCLSVWIEGYPQENNNNQVSCYPFNNNHQTAIVQSYSSLITVTMTHEWNTRKNKQVWRIIYRCCLVIDKWNY